MSDGHHVSQLLRDVCLLSPFEVVVLQSVVVQPFQRLHTSLLTDFLQILQMSRSLDIDAGETPLRAIQRVLNR